MQRTGESRVRTRQRVAAVTAVVAMVMGVFVALGASAPAQAAGSPCGQTINSIVCENSKPGTDPSVWDIDGAGDDTIQGFSTDISVNAGGRIDFKVDTNARAYTIDVYRTGWYQGKGARFIQSVPVTASLPQSQPQCISDVSTELYDCGTWKVSATWNVPDTAVSGVYVAKLTRSDTSGSSHITFIVRNDASQSDIVFQTSDPTWQAYNTYGGSDFYRGAANGRAYKISYNRPVATRGSNAGRDFYFSAEYATVRFLERNGYDMTYISGVDTDRYGSQLLNHKVFLSVGHDEYWSGAQRKNVEAARDAGVNLQFLSGNEVYWRTRYEASADPSKTAYRTLVSYKETWANDKIDPSSEWTGTWRDPRFSTAANGGTSPENALTGTMYFVNDVDLAVTVNSEEGKLRLWRNTSLASLASGAKAALAPHTIGYESDEDADNGFRPAGLIRLSTTMGPTPQYLTDYGNVVMPGTTEHHLTMYRAASGALVFGAGTIQWGWGLDQQHDGDGTPADARMQQAQVNLLADMGAQPGSMMSGLVAATKSTDTTAPVTTISSPTAGQQIAHGTSTTITGTASDAGGRVAGVEVSVDGGETWHPAKGTTNWSYSYVQQGNAATTLLARAADDSGNFSAAGTSVSVDVTGPFTVFGSSVPAQPSASDTQALELGLTFTPQSDGYVSGVRFFKGAANTGIHTGTLWSDTGRALARVQFTGESATGWQAATFSAPVPVSAGLEYVVSYTAPNGGYAYTERFWPYQATPTSPLTTIPGAGNNTPGVYGTPGTFPQLQYGGANYYVDAVFSSTDNSPLSVITQAPLAGSTSAAPDAVVSAKFNRAVVPTSVQLQVADASGATATGTIAYDAVTKTATFTPTTRLASGTTYTVTPAAADANGMTLAGGSAWTFTTQTADLPEGTCPCGLFSESVRPVIDSDTDTGQVTLGVRFTASQNGEISALKYFRGMNAPSGPRTGNLWSSAGTKLATVVFDGASSYGWQTAVLTTPVPVTAGQTYVVSYLAPQGGYSATPGQFNARYVRGPLSVEANGAAFVYQDGFPTGTSSTGYLVDVVFQPKAQAPTLVATTPVSGDGAAAPGTTISATYSLPIASGFSGSVRSGGNDVGGSWGRSPDGRSAVFTPSAPLPGNASVTVQLTNVRGAEGGDASDVTWSFGVAPQDGATVVTLLGDQTPQVASDTDTGSVELGMAFRTSEPGTVRAIRFYKGAGNTGVHTGALWGPTGQQLASVTFTGESASGWQRAALSSTVSLSPGTLYAVSYHAPQGGYAFTSAGFATAVSSGPITAVSVDNGRFVYGSTPSMPTGSWNSTNYFVDLEFVPTTTAPSITELAPARDAADAAPGASVSATFDRDVTGRTPLLSLATAAGASVPGSSSYDAQTRRVLFTPSTALSVGAGYTATARLDGAVLEQWSFTVAASATPVGDTLFGMAVPANPALDEPAQVELGTAFRVTETGKAIAIRFYKGQGNTGTHVGTLWTADGQVLGQVTFTGDTTIGWQRAVLPTPVDLTAGVTYVVSYYTPSGNFPTEGGYFATERANGKIVGLSPNNGLFRYGAGGGFPTSSWGSTAYFVDAEISFGGSAQPAPTPTPTPAPALTATTPAPNASGLEPTTTKVTATLTDATGAAFATKVKPDQVSLFTTGTPTSASTSYPSTVSRHRFWVDIIFDPDD